MKRWARFVLLLVIPVSALPAEAQQPLAPTTMYAMPAPGGWALAPDNVTLIVSQPKTAELLFFDTVAETLEKRIELDFAPGPMLYIGDTLYVAGDGSGIVHAIDPDSGKIRKKYTVRGNAITDLAGHPADKYFYAATSTYEVFSLDTETARTRKTDAVGNLVIVDPNDSGRVFTGVKRNDTRDVFIIKSGRRRGDVQVFWDQWGPRSALVRYSAKEGLLEIESVQGNATVNAYAMSLTPDGERIMMTGGGGWRPPADVSTVGGYYTAVFSSNELETMVGRAPHATQFAFHPVLNIAVGNHVGRDLKIIDSRSYVERQAIHLADGADMRPLLLTFAAKGTKIVVWNGDNPKNPREGLHFVAFDLSDTDRASLEQIYGKLPEAPKIAARTGASSTSAVPSEPVPDGKPLPAKPTDPTVDEPDPAGLLAVAGFNNRRGLGIGRTGRGSYSPGVARSLAGTGEAGWSGPWPSLENATYQNKTLFEGDGALQLTGTANFARGFSRPLDGVVEIELSINIPAGGNLSCYVWEENHNSCGPMWRVKDGKIEVLSGNEGGAGKWIDTRVTASGNAWMTIALRIDTENRRWRFLIPKSDYDSGELMYRSRPRELRQINFLTESSAGAFIDAIQLRRPSADQGQPSK